MSRDLAIADGSHRLTLAFYHHQEFINGRVLSIVRNRSFDYDFFWKMGFTPAECCLIRKKCDEMLASLNYDFIGVIWPPAMKWADEIIEDVRLYNSKEIEVFNIKDYILEKGDFVHIFRGLYHTDILDENGMNDKIKLIENCMPEKDGEWPIRVFQLHIVNPQIAINPKNFSTQSQLVMRIKKTFRERYALKIQNYQYDVIMHISDNYLQSKFCRILFEIDRDISFFFKRQKIMSMLCFGQRNPGSIPRSHENFISVGTRIF